MRSRIMKRRGVAVARVGDGRVVMVAWIHHSRVVPVPAVRYGHGVGVGRSAAKLSILEWAIERRAGATAFWPAGEDEALCQLHLLGPIRARVTPVDEKQHLALLEYLSLLQQRIVLLQRVQPLKHGHISTGRSDRSRSAAEESTDDKADEDQRC